MGTMSCVTLFPPWLDQLDAERPRLVRLCARLTGDPDAAEDLAQETVAAAYRGAGGLRDPERGREWLSGIARNVCRRWLQRRGRVAARLASEATATAEPADHVDIELELERAELAALLDRALALLPTETRAVLVQRFVDESPVGDIARRLGLSEGAVAMRLQRGKLTLRRVLLTDFREQAASYGLVDADEWQATRIWCPACGQRRLMGRFTGDHDELWLRCPVCTPPGAFGWHGTRPELRQVKAFKLAMTRFIRATAGRRLGQLGGPTLPCLACGRPTPFRMGMPADMPAVAHLEPGFHTRCAACGNRTESSLLGLVLGLPEAERFWRDHPRMRRLPLRSIGDVDGQPAVLTTMVSVGTGDRLEVVTAADTLRVLSVRRL
jgi:RNA polymerase sigma factor (sigma-70 family)